MRSCAEVLGVRAPVYELWGPNSACDHLQHFPILAACPNSSPDSVARWDVWRGPANQAQDPRCPSPLQRVCDLRQDTSPPRADPGTIRGPLCLSTLGFLVTRWLM